MTVTEVDLSAAGLTDYQIIRLRRLRGARLVRLEQAWRRLLWIRFLVITGRINDRKG